MWRRLRLDQQVFLLALGAGIPGAVTALWILWTEPYTPKVQWTLTVIILSTLFGLAASVRTRVVVPLQTLANLLAALREDDFSIRGRTANPDDPLGAALIEINALAETLHEQRLGAVEATALLRTVMEQIDVAVFAFDPQHRLRIVNRTGERLMGKSMEHMLGRTAEELSLSRMVRRCASRRRHLAARRRARPMGGPPDDVPARRTAARSAGAVGRQPAAARTGAPGVAAADSRHRPRARQLARPDQVDRRLAREPAAIAIRRRTTGAKTCSAACR